MTFVVQIVLKLRIISQSALCHTDFYKVAGLMFLEVGSKKRYNSEANDRWMFLRMRRRNFDDRRTSAGEKRLFLCCPKL